jgi:hypothetical protein
MTEQNRLLLNIVKSTESTVSAHADLNQPLTKRSSPDAATAFHAASDSVDIHSVFDIIRQPKSVFARQVKTLSEANPILNGVSAELTYDNAMCYAIQIGRLYREQETSSTEVTPTGQVNSRTLSGHSPDHPGYENMFKEKWGEFCKVGAISAVDSPVAYLRSLYRLITTVVEPGGKGTRDKIKLEDRRPDLKNLLVDQQSTFTPLPMLNIANEVLRKNIEEFLGDDPVPLPQKLAEKRHPFLFPYDFTHHQCLLGLGEKDTPLGEINYRVSQQLPTLRDAKNEFGKQGELSSAVAQGLLSGLSPEQQKLITEPTLFSDFYISRTSMESHGWISPGASTFSPWQGLMFGFVLPDQDSIKKCTPSASELSLDDAQRFNTVEINFTKPGSPPLALRFAMASNRPPSGTYNDFIINHTYHTVNYIKAFKIRLFSGQTLPTTEGYTATFTVLSIANDGLEVPTLPQKGFMKRSFTLCLDDIGADDYLLPENQKLFFKRHYGVEPLSSNLNPLSAVDTFMRQTGLNANDVEALLALREYAPKVSANCRSLNVMRDGHSNNVLKFPYSSHYGASYVNGLGATGSEPGWTDANGNFMNLKEVEVNGSKSWRLTNTSLQRFDRMQRMIRLQRWMKIPFAELDTLIVAAMRAEGEANLEMALNDNTLRTLGVFRHLSQRYSIKAEEFAAFLYYLTPYANADRTPLFDAVFNSPALFDTPLILDQTPFETAGDNPEDQKTVYQLCAGLGLQPTETSFERLANNTKAHVGPLSRSLTIVSSLYRQARIAQLFGLSAEEGWALADLLGGDAYHKAVASGALRTAGDQPDILDILMQMDWAVSWLKESKQNISTVRTQIGLDPSTLVPKQALVDRLERLYQNTQPTLITEQQVSGLNLPNTPANAINWLTEIKRKLVSDIGLVKALALQQSNDVEAQLIAGLETLIKPLELSLEEKTLAQDKLCDLLATAHDRQLRLIEGLLQEVANVPMERAAVVTHWAGLSAEALLTIVDKAGKDHRLTLKNFDPELLESLQGLLRHAHIAHTFNLSEPALRLFLANLSLLGAPLMDNVPSLGSFYLLGRYKHLVDQLDEPEEALLNYLLLANGISTDSADAERIAHELAKLLSWSKSETLTLVRLLPDQQATTLANVDWVYRCKQLCDASGLTAASLLSALTLNPDSPLADWKLVAEAAIAATR